MFVLSNRIPSGDCKPSSTVAISVVLRGSALNKVSLSGAAVNSCLFLFI